MVAYDFPLLGVFWSLVLLFVFVLIVTGPKAVLFWLVYHVAMWAWRWCGRQRAFSRRWYWDLGFSGLAGTAASNRGTTKSPAR